MSDKHRSLASYFDEPGDGPYSWHDQTEPLQAPPAPGRGLGGHDPETLGRWMYVPTRNDMLWVPEGKHWSDHNKEPKSTTYRYKKDAGDWKPTDWGYEEYMKKQAQANMPKSDPPAEPKKKMSPEERKAWKSKNATARQTTRTKRSASVKAFHDEAYNTLNGIAQSLPNTDPLHKIHKIILDVTNLLENAKQQSKDKRTELAGVENMTNKERKATLHEETSQYIFDDTWTGANGVLAKIDEYCQTNTIFNTLGKELPDIHEDSTRFLSVEILFLSKAKEVMMSAILHVLAVKAKAGTANTQECDYVNASYAANDILYKMRGKDRYMRQPDTKLPDSAAIVGCKNMIMKLEQQRFKKLHPGKPLPKHFQWSPPGENHKKGKGGHGKGAGHSSEQKEFEMFKKFYNMKQGGNHNHPHHGPPHPGKAITPSSAPGPRRMPPTQRHPRAAAYMHGYYY